MNANDSSLHMLLDKERALESCDGINLCGPNIVSTQPNTVVLTAIPNLCTKDETYLNI